MNKRWKNISQEILGQKQLQENIPQLFNYLANHYETYASVKLAMHYYAFYEAFLDEEDTWSSGAKDIMQQLNEIIKNNVLTSCSGASREKAIVAADTMRNEIGHRMNMLTTYTDIFLTYEYVLNRLEYRFQGKPEAIDEEEFAKNILRYIFESEDNFVINEKIREIIGQLPIRITKQKYYDLLRDSLSSYLGADMSSLQTYLYMLRTSAMLYREEGMDQAYPQLWEKMQKLAAMDYKNMTKSIFDQANTILQAATMILETETSAYLSLQEMINEIYSILLCSSYAGMAADDYEVAEKTAMDIIRRTNELFASENKEEFTMDEMDLFEKIEGVQEEISYELTVMEDALYEVSHNHEQLAKSMMLDQLMRILMITQKLLSSSLFIDLTDEKEDMTVEEDVLERETDALLNEVSSLFEAQDKIISRAVVANTLSKMPVFFRDHKEVMEYVRYSMERCTDQYEKAACFEIINELMSE